MEIKATLNKPYTETQRLDFIVEQNHNNGYEVRETETVLEAWGYTQEEINQQEQERVNHLTMTALDLITAVKTLGLSDEQIENYLNQNLNVKHQLMFCQNVYCGVVKAMCPIDIGEVRLEVADVEALFKAKHGEV